MRAARRASMPTCLPVLDGDRGDARGRRDAEPHPPGRFGRAEGAAHARPRAARDAALVDPPARPRDAERGGRGDPLRGARLLPRCRDDRRPRRLRRGALPRPDRDRQRARHALGRRAHDLRVRDARAGHGARHVRPHRARLRRDEPRHDRRARPALAAARRRARSCGPETACSTRVAGRATSRSRPSAEAGESSGSTSRRGCSSARGGSPARSSGCRATRSRCPFEDAEFDAATVGFGVRNLADLEGGLRELGACPAARRQARRARDHAAARSPAAVLPALVRRPRPARGRVLPGGRGVHVPARERPPVPRP